jgi:hypothetical protein
LEEILAEEHMFIGADTASNILLPFFVKPGYEGLLFQFSYEPKFLDDEALAVNLLKKSLAKYEGALEDQPDFKAYLPLQNLLTLSLFAPDAYLGSAHRQNPCQQHLISESFASYGFQPHPITKGIWKAAVNAHCVITDFCSWKLRIYALCEEEMM